MVVVAPSAVECDVTVRHGPSLFASISKQYTREEEEEGGIEYPTAAGRDSSPTEAQQIAAPFTTTPFLTG